VGWEGIFCSRAYGQGVGPWKKKEKKKEKAENGCQMKIQRLFGAMRLFFKIFFI
jgi:hypothetical protein